MATYKLIPNCTFEDAAGIAKNNMTAFYGETWWNMQWDIPLERIIYMTTKRYPHNLLRDRHVRRHQKVVDTATGEVVGYARWILPESYADSWLEAQPPDASDEDKVRFKKDFDEQPWRTRPEVDDSDELVGEQLRKYTPRVPYIKLDYLGVHPDHHRKGIASMLVQSGVKTANELGIDLYLVAMGINACNLYKKYGFEELDSLSQDLNRWGFQGTYDTWILIKHPDTVSH